MAETAEEHPHHPPLDPLMQEMLEWEVHRLRTELQVIVLRLQFYTRNHPSALPLMAQLIAAKDQLEVDQLNHLLDEKKILEGPVSS